MANQNMHYKACGTNTIYIYLLFSALERDAPTHNVAKPVYNPHGRNDRWFRISRSGHTKRFFFFPKRTFISLTGNEYGNVVVVSEQFFNTVLNSLLNNESSRTSTAPIILASVGSHGELS